MNELFTLSRLCSSEMLKDNIKYVLCGKVHAPRNENNLIKYVIDKDSDNWVVHLMNNEVLHLP